MLLIIIGFVLVVLGAISLKPRKGKWGLLSSVTAIAIGCLFILYDLLKISNPGLEELWDIGFYVLGLAGGAYTIGKLLTWMVTRTDFYQSFMDALRSVPEIKESVKNIEKTVTGGGSSLSKNNPEEEKKKEEERPPRGARPLAGLVGGALLGGAVAGPPGAVVGALIGLFLGASAEAEEERRRKKEKS